MTDKKMGRPKTVIDGKNRTFFIPAKTIQKIVEKSNEKGISQNVYVTMAVDAFEN